MPQILSHENVPLYNWNDKNITHTFILHVPIGLKQKPFLGMTRMCNHETRPDNYLIEFAQKIPTL